MAISSSPATTPSIKLPSMMVSNKMRGSFCTCAPSTRGKAGWAGSAKMKHASMQSGTKHMRAAKAENGNTFDSGAANSSTAQLAMQLRTMLVTPSSAIRRTNSGTKHAQPNEESATHGSDVQPWLKPWPKNSCASDDKDMHSAAATSHERFDTRFPAPIYAASIPQHTTSAKLAATKLPSMGMP